MSRPPRTVLTPGEPAPAPAPILGTGSENAGLPPEAATSADTGPLDTASASEAPLKTTEPLAGDAGQLLAGLQAQMAEALEAMRLQSAQLAALREQNTQLARQVTRTVPAVEPVVLPTVEEAKASNPDAPVMTQDGWYTPPVTSANPIRPRVSA